MNIVERQEIGWCSTFVPVSSPSSLNVGRPRIVDDPIILEAALEAFAIDGFEGMSLRSLNRTLGLSHATINQRFGTKEALYTAAIDHGFRCLLDDLKAIVAEADLPSEPLDELRWRLRAFLLAAARRPHIGRLLNHEGLAASPRLDHIYDCYIGPSMSVTIELIKRLADAGVVHDVSPRVVFFVLVHGGATVFTLQGLSDKFDPSSGPTNAEPLAAEIADFLIRGLLRPVP
jgi:AcrR family transcriptional regulator